MIALPALPEEVPKYYKDIVEICRLRDPIQRPPARKLLEMFLLTNELTSEPEPEAEKALVLRQIVDEFNHLEILCDMCEEETSAQAFHCNVCSDGDFDICLTCMNKGVHCYDPAHFLVEMASKQGVLVALNSYYSSMKADGKRDVVHL
ncbi:hypothetical protein DL95DRAFT_486091 [Leptodontidium sp. 2 PMI_412]|nr:hypothetical protein DL95DRAFT_486091 [Leptodontidium sp. 2 PMI_412]